MLMEIRTGISLKKYTTMQLDGEARFLAPVTSVNEVISVYRNAKAKNLPIFVLGGGSNVVVRGAYNGLIILNRIKGFEVLADDRSYATIKIGAGEIWDEVVRRTVEMGLRGIEAMSAIPGTAGAAPVQNVGAYGQEIADTLVSLEAYDTEKDEIVTLTAEECHFSYRDSIFRNTAAGRYCIVSITIRLQHGQPQPPFYDSLQRYLDEHSISIITLQAVRDAVIAIRAEKLPDPAVLPNTGSFFKNAIIDKWKLTELQKQFPTIPFHEMPENQFKIPSGWLIQQTGLKGKLLHGMRVYEKNALVLVNESAGTYENLAAAREEIIQTVYDMFQIQLVQEPLEL